MATNHPASPVDWKVQATPPGNSRFNIKYPAILGQDIAGEVWYVGRGVRDLFAKGDRVLAHTHGVALGGEYGGFQLYVKAKAITVAKIPEDYDGDKGSASSFSSSSSYSFTGMKTGVNTAFEKAVVLPLSISTAAAGLFLGTQLGLRLPEVPSTTSGRNYHSNKNNAATTEALLLWGGSSSVGSSVVQLAVAAGYTVITTASPANYAYCKALGATRVLDYHNPDIVALLAAVLESSGLTLVGAYDAIGTEETVRQSAAVVSALTRKRLGAAGSEARIVSVGWAPEGGRVLVDTAAAAAAAAGAGTGALYEGEEKGGVEVVRISSTQIISLEEGRVAKRVWGEYLPVALKTGEVKPAPEGQVIGRGLYYLQQGLDLNKRGVSAAKVVVSL